MNRAEFMRQLESLLLNVPEAEREEALQYYNDYFDDAGEENEQDVIAALGTPARVAENIKKDWLGYGESLSKQPVAGDRALMEYGTEQARAGADATNPFATEMSQVIQAPQTASTLQDTTAPRTGSTKMPGWAIALLVVLIILASPVGIGLLGVLFGLIVTWFAFIFAFGVIFIALFCVFLILLGTGVVCLFVEPGVGISLLGGSLICGGVAVIFLILTVLMAGWATPGICRGIASLFRRK